LAKLPVLPFTFTGITNVFPEEKPQKTKMITDLNTYTALILFLLLTAFFGGVGSAFLSVNRNKTDKKERGTGLSSFLIPLFLSNPAVFLTSILLGYFISLCLFVLSFTGIFSVIPGVSSPLVTVILQIIALFLILAFTVLLLRMSIFRTRPEAAMKFFSIPALIGYMVLFLPGLVIVWFVTFISRFILGIRGNIRKEGYFFDFSHPEYFSPFLIDDAVRESDEEEEPELKIFQNVLEFSKIKVRDCMVPRNEIACLDINSTIEELREQFIESGYSKILVYQDTIDNMIGYISSKELFKCPESIGAGLVSLSVVPETMQINKLFRSLIKERRSIALVVDEYGGTSGIVTLEDIMEEIFGEIEDEHDTQDFIERQVNENEFILSGRLEIDYLNEKYRLGIPETEDYDTLAGYIIFHYSNIPKLNTNVRVGDLHMRMLKVSQTKIELVHVSRVRSEE
jgi:CBS domain containing-hemolysin-like protein